MQEMKGLPCAGNRKDYHVQEMKGLPCVGDRKDYHVQGIGRTTMCRR